MAADRCIECLEQLRTISNEHYNPSPPFHWDNLDVTTKNPLCGVNKCFYFDKVYPNIGYLVTSKRLDKFSLTTEMNAYKLAQRLESEHQIRHFLDGPPEVTKVPMHMVDPLNSSINVVGIGHMTNINKSRFKSNMDVIVQRNHVGPVPHVLIGCTGRKREYTIPMFDDFFDSVVTDHQSFANQLYTELESTITLLMKEPILFTDFQVMVDTYGQVYHLDFDRTHKDIDSAGNAKKQIMAAPPCNEICIECVEHLKTITARLLWKLEQLDQNLIFR